MSVKIRLEKKEMCDAKKRVVAGVSLQNLCFWALTQESERNLKKNSQRLKSLLQSEDEGAQGWTE